MCEVRNSQFGAVASAQEGMEAPDPYCLDTIETFITIMIHQTTAGCCYIVANDVLRFGGLVSDVHL